MKGGDRRENQSGPEAWSRAVRPWLTITWPLVVVLALVFDVEALAAVVLIGPFFISLVVPTLARVGETVVVLVGVGAMVVATQRWLGYGNYADVGGFMFYAVFLAAATAPLGLVFGTLVMRIAQFARLRRLDPNLPA